jgi:hypothetical protein
MLQREREREERKRKRKRERKERERERERKEREREREREATYHIKPFRFSCETPEQLNDLKHCCNTMTILPNRVARWLFFKPKSQFG